MAMARIPPEAFPDRLALDAYARRCRARETGRMLGAVAHWLRLPQHGVRHAATFDGPLATARSAAR
jgi:hypothetical protein